MQTVYQPHPIAPLVEAPHGTQIATTDFCRAGASYQFRRMSLITDVFWIDGSNELVYVADDGSLEVLGPSRAYGYETKLSVEITRKLSLDGGITKVANAFYRGTTPRIYVDRAPRFVANAGLTLSGWHGWSGSLRMRAINHYRLDGEDPSLVAAGNTIFDLSIVRRPPPRGGVQSRLRQPDRPPLLRDTELLRIAPGYPLTVTAGLTFRFGGK